jgi:two-component system sensor histidine kinase ChiS
MKFALPSLIAIPGARIKLLLFVVCLALPVGAQNNDLFFDAVTPAAHSLPVGQVQAILQDRYGFMWFGVQAGLARYDGQVVTIYRHDPNDPRSLSDNNVTALYEDRQGRLWVGTHVGGLNRFDRAAGSFTRYQHDPAKPDGIGRGAIWAIYEDQAGTFWLSLTEGGLARMDREAGTFRHFLPAPESPGSPLNKLINLYEDRLGNFWLCARGGLVRYDRAGGSFTAFTPEPKTPALIIQVYEDRGGRLWAGSLQGLMRFDRNTGQFTRLTHDPRNPDSLSSNAVTAIAEDQAGRLWIGTENGLNRWEPESGRFTRYNNDMAAPGSLLDNLVVTLYRDRAGSLWIGSAGGVNRIHRGVERFLRYRFQANNPRGLSNSNVFQVHEDRARDIWIATGGGGVNKLNRQTGKFEHFRHDPRNPRSLSSDQTISIHEDRTGALWVGTRDAGLNLSDRRTGEFSRFRAELNNPASLSGDQVQSILEDSAGTLWVGTFGGLNQFDRQRRQFIRFVHDPANPRSLSSNRVVEIHEARDGTFWVATDGGGLNMMDRQSGQFTVFKHRPEDAHSLSSNAVMSLAEDAAGALWIATLGGGINRFDRASGRFSRFTEKDGLASNNVWGILADGDGVLWMNTELGVARFDPRTGKFRRYTVRDGLAADTPAQNGHALTRSGELILGGGGGFTIFNPRQLNDEPSVPPPVALTAFKKFDQLVNFEQGLADIGEIKLAQRENFFSFEFAVLDFKEPGRNQYAYKLEGFDPDWIFCGTRHYTSYTNLDAGTYLFRVKGADSKGVWNEQGVAVKVVITPPFWRTRWFLALIVALFGGAIWLAYWRRVRQLKRTQAAQEDFAKQLIASQESERQRIAAELHDGLGQNLLIIKNHALLGLAERQDPVATEENLTAISEMTSQVLDETREIAYNLRPYQIDRFGLTKALQSMLNRVAEASEIRFQSEVDFLDKLFSKEAEMNLYRIVQESINNILKHSRATDAEIRIVRTGQRVLLRIADNGQGLASDADGEAAKRGFGLTGMAERARILGGYCQLQSTPGQGTVISISIPLPENTHAKS